MKILKTLIIALLCSIQVYATIYEDAEDERTDRWKVYDATPEGAYIDNVYLEERDHNAIEFIGSGTGNGYILGNWEGKSGAWNNTKEHTLKWSMNFDEEYTIYIRAMTKNGTKYIYYTPSDKSYGKKNNEYIHIGLGSKTKNGTWQDFSRDLASDLEKYEPNNRLLSVNAFLLRGNGLIDNIKLEKTLPKNSIESIDAQSNEDFLILGMNGVFEEAVHSSFFIDVDNDVSTGYSNNEIKGADYLVQDNKLYKYPENIKTWKWDSIGDELITERTSTRISSKIPLDMLDINNHINYLAGITSSNWKRNIKYESMREYTLSDKKAKSITIGARPIKATQKNKGKLFASPNGQGDCMSYDSACDIETAIYKLSNTNNVLFLKSGTYHLKNRIAFIEKLVKVEKPFIIESFNPHKKAILTGNFKGTEIIKVYKTQHIHFRNLEIKSFNGFGIRLRQASDIKIEGCVIHDNKASGISLYESSNNTIIDNIIYSNQDNNLGNADGIQIQFPGTSINNKIIHNTVYHNSDDGIDTFGGINTIIKYNISFNNIGEEGQGNGIGIKACSSYSRGTKIEHNIAFGNAGNGFECNENNGENVIFKYNTAYNNKGYGFENNRNNSQAKLSMNISSDNNAGDAQNGIQENNSWDTPIDIAFISRKFGSKEFLKPEIDSGFENMGAYVNIPVYNNKQVKIFVIGDSTVHNRKIGLHEMGWANTDAMGSYMLNPSNLYNEGRSGASSKSYKIPYASRHDWEETKKIIFNTDISRGAYLFIQFGHNDEREHAYTTPNEFYTQLEEYVDWAKANNIIPVLITPVERRAKSKGNLNHKTHEEAGGYAQKVRDLAEARGITLLDLQDKSWNEYNKYEDTNAINKVLAYDDNTHFSPKGAKIVGGWLKELICESNEEKLCFQFK